MEEQHSIISIEQHSIISILQCLIQGRHVRFKCKLCHYLHIKFFLLNK